MRVKKIILLTGIAWIVPAVYLHATSNIITSYYSVRSQASFLAQNLIGIVDYIHLPKEDFYRCASGYVSYSHSFNSDIVSDSLFGNDIQAPLDDKRRLRILGSQVPDRNNQFDWLADYFGLPTDFESTVTLNPQIQNCTITIDFFMGLAPILNGLFLRCNVPFVQTRRTMGLRECIKNGGENSYVAGYFAPTAVERSRLLSNFTDFIQNEQVPQLPNSITFEPLRFAKMSEHFLKSKTGLAEINLALGYDLLLCDEYHFGLSIQLALPLGTKPKGKFLFEPVVGNGRHMVIGAGITAHAIIWKNEYCNRSLSVYLDGTVCDLLVAKQTRFFDLRERKNSRYMLAQRLSLPIEDDLHTLEFGTTTTFPEAQFKSYYTPVANLTTTSVKVHGGFETNVALMVHYIHHCCSFDFGYDFWFRSCEHVHLDDCSPQRLARHQWVLKGDAHNFGFNENTGAAVALSASQSGADIYHGLNTTEIDSATNPNINNPVRAFTTADVPLVTIPAGSDQINTSIQPLFILPSSLDLCSSSSESTIHTFFVNFSYEACSWNNLIPSFSVGAKISGAIADDNPYKQVTIGRCNDPCSNNQFVACSHCSGQCRGCGIFEYGFWIKGAIAFN